MLSRRRHLGAPRTPPAASPPPAVSVSSPPRCERVCRPGFTPRVRPARRSRRSPLHRRDVLLVSVPVPVVVVVAVPVFGGDPRARSMGSFGEIEGGASCRPPRPRPGVLPGDVPLQERPAHVRIHRVPRTAYRTPHRVPSSGLVVGALGGLGEPIDAPVGRLAPPRQPTRAVGLESSDQIRVGVGGVVPRGVGGGREQPVVLHAGFPRRGGYRPAAVSSVNRSRLEVSNELSEEEAIYFDKSQHKLCD